MVARVVGTGIYANRWTGTCNSLSGTWHSRINGRIDLEIKEAKHSRIAILRVNLTRNDNHPYLCKTTLRGSLSTFDLCNLCRRDTSTRPWFQVLPMQSNHPTGRCLGNLHKARSNQRTVMRMKQLSADIRPA